MSPEPGAPEPIRYVARAYATEDAQAAAYALAQGNLLAGPRVNVSCYRILQGGRHVVCVVGEDADESMLQGGEPYTLSEQIIGFLIERRAQLAALGLTVQGHHDPGLGVKL